MQNAELIGVSWYIKQDKPPEPGKHQDRLSCLVSYVCGTDDRK